jgi:phage I-like protein
MKHESTLPPNTALMAEQALPTDGGAPEWIHLIPTSEGAVATKDKRGPYHVSDAQSIIAASFAHSDALEIDINHSTFTAAPQGQRSDAVGWIDQMEVRPDGIWGHVEWNAEGARLIKRRAYRRISPVVIHDTAKNIVRIANASLVNRPNFCGLAALNQENPMTFMERLAELLGLDGAATEDQVVKAVKAMKASKMETAAPQAAQPEELIALQAEVTTLAADLKSERETRAREKAEAFVDGEIAKGRVGVKPSRERFIAMHMADPSGAAEIIGGLTLLAPTATTTTAKAPTAPDGEVSLNAEQLLIAKMSGLDPKTYAAALAADQKGDTQ